MGLPHLDLTFLSSQVFWLLFATGCSYFFNKTFFLPSLLGNLKKRKVLLEKLNQEKEDFLLEVDNLEKKIKETFLLNQQEARKIVGNAAELANRLLQEQIKRMNEFSQEKMEEYNLKASKVREEIESNLHIIVDDIKVTAKNFILYNVE